MAVKIAIDVGGTFTDVFAIDDRTGAQWIGKVATVPEDPSKGVVNGVQRLLRDHEIESRSVTHVSQGTTVATNAILQRKGAKTALLTTRGFRDVIEIGRQSRPDLYDLAKPKVEPLVDEPLRFEVDERINAAGDIETPLSPDEVREVAGRMAAARVEAVAVCFLHAYRHPAHELQAVEILRQTLPHAYICCSSEVVSEFREYERTVTTALNAMLGPVVSGYVGRIKKRLVESGVDAAVSIVQSNGGMVSADVASERPVYLALSGPSAGVAGASLIAREAGFPNVIAFDMGGTSTDVCLIANGRVPVTSNRKIAGLPCRVPMVDIETVGAGGGSIAWIDVGNFLKVGPHSAGADPGPAAYGKGNSKPTVTDANLVLNRLGSGSLLGGELSLDRQLAIDAIEACVARPLGLSLEDAALGIVRIANANMVRAVRSVSLQRGVDPRDYALLAFGGAGPMHAVFVARELGIKTVLVPPSPGVLCAIGAMGSDIRTDVVRSVILPATEESLPSLKRAVEDLTAQARRWLEAQGYAATQAKIDVDLDMRYKGQSYELQVHGCTLTSDADVAAAVEAFHRLHETTYGYANLKRIVQVINIRVTASIHSAYRTTVPTSRTDISTRPATHRNVHFDGMKSPLRTPVLWRASLEGDFDGPAVVESMDSTVLVPPEARVHVDKLGNLIIT